MTSDTVGNAKERMASFSREIEEANEFDAENHGAEVAVTIIEDEDTLSVDLQPALTAGLRYGLVAFDGEAGSNVVTLHFKPQEHTGFFEPERSEEPDGQKRVVIEFRHRQPDDPTTFPKGGLPEMDPGETTATCRSCGYFGIVPDDSEVVNANALGTDTVLICATCADVEGRDQDAA